MPSNLLWGAGGADAGGSGVALGSDFTDQEGARVSADGSTFPGQIVIGEGGADAGGEAEVAD